jgi:hypothetical protein
MVTLNLTEDIIQITLLSQLTGHANHYKVLRYPDQNSMPQSDATGLEVRFNPQVEWKGAGDRSSWIGKNYAESRLKRKKQARLRTFQCKNEVNLLGY